VNNWDEFYPSTAENEADILDRIMEVDLSTNRSDEIIFSAGRLSILNELLDKK
jgi:hypothetical protein